ncbi:MAG: hypothetical protein WA913_15785 [Pricia sp.]
MKIKHLIQMASILALSTIGAQNSHTANFDTDAWEIQAKNSEFKEYKGKRALFLDRGIARLKNAAFEEGIVEYDISFEEKRNFAGIHFHIKDSLNYEEFYLRPHQSGNPDAMQYTPVINGNAAWQLYTGEGYWSAMDFSFGEWMHVKLVVSGEKMDVFIENMEKPILHVYNLKLGRLSGGFGFGTFLGAAYYANLTYQKIENPETIGKPDSEIKVEPNSILDWQVSKAFSEVELLGLVSLEELNVPIEKQLKTDPMGILNLSQISKVSDDTNTILAKFTLDADKNLLKKMDFGYSDKVVVFVNGKPIYSGNNSFRTRDYRYLGSIGFFDSVYLNLQKGKNEIVFAVTERMGGWGVVAKVSD